MKSPIDEQEFNKYIDIAKDEKEVAKMLDERAERYKNAGNGKGTMEETYKNCFIDFLVDIGRFKYNNPADFELKTDFIYKIFDDDVLYLQIPLGDLMVSIKKPISLRDITTIKKLAMNVEDEDDIIELQKKAGDLIKIYQKEMEVKDVGNLPYEKSMVFFQFTRIIYDYFILCVTSIRGSGAKN